MYYFVVLTWKSLLLISYHQNRIDPLEIFVTSMDRCSNGHSNKNAESIINEQFNYQHTTNNIYSTVLMYRNCS